jgi:hypothetical protein
MQVARQLVMGQVQESQVGLAGQVSRQGAYRGLQQAAGQHDKLLNNVHGLVTAHTTAAGNAYSRIAAVMPCATQSKLERRVITV